VLQFLKREIPMKMRLAGLVAVVALAGGVAGAQDMGQGMALYNEGRYAEAEPIFRAAAPTDPEGRAWLAATLVRLGRNAEAEAEAKAVLEANPVHPMAVRALGESLVMQEKLDEAVARMSAALEAKNDLAYAYYWRGQAYQRQKHVARMVDDYQAFLTLEPEAPEAPALKVLLASLR
jgi:tetratricopeptide (TPR) repeat protein